MIVWKTKTDTYSSRSKDVLGEDNSLGLNYEEIDELMNVSNHGVKSFFGHNVVLSRTNLACKTLREQSLANDFSCHGNTKGHPGQFEGISKEAEISGTEDEENDRDIGDCRRTRILPAQKAREERMIMC